MGKSDYGFMSGFSGRLGNLIGYRWRGRMCIRTMPSHYRDARTPEQLQQRALFKAVVRFASRARQVLKKGMNAVSLDAQMTESNYFMRVNKRCFALAAGTPSPRLRNDEADSTGPAGEAPAYQGELQVDYENLLLADGPVAPVAFYEPQMLDEATLSVDFEKNPLHRVVKWEDLVYVAAYCPELGDFDISTPVYRRSNRLTMSLNPYWTGREVHLWGFVVDSQGRASQSQYLGCIVPDQTDIQSPRQQTARSGPTGLASEIFSASLSERQQAATSAAEQLSAAYRPVHQLVAADVPSVRGLFSPPKRE